MRLRERKPLGDISNVSTRHREEKLAVQPRLKRQRTQTGSAEAKEADASASVSSSDSALLPARKRSAKTISKTQSKQPRASEQSAPSKDEKRCRRPEDALEVVEELYFHLYEAELQLVVRPYMHQQPDINAKMRCILIDWIVEVHYKFKLTHQSLFLCVNIIDRYLQDVRIARGKLQLVGVTALLIACKYEETRVPEIQDCVSITDEAYSREDILEMEVMILTQLKFQLTVPTPFHFMARYLEIASASDVMRHVAAYYSDRNLLEHCMLAYDPSQFASAVVYSALSYMHQFDESFQKSPAARDGRWPQALETESGFSEMELKPIAGQMMKHMDTKIVTSSQRQLDATTKKYQVEKYNFASNLRLPTI